MNATSRLKKAQIIGKLLRDYIEEKGWSVSDAAVRAGIHPSSMRDYVAGITLPMKESRESVAAFLGIPLRDLNAHIGEAPPREERPVEDLCADIRQVTDPNDLALLLETITLQVAKALRQAEKQA